MTHHLVGPAEIAAMLGVSRQRVHQIEHEDPSFPMPAAELATGRVWETADVEKWIKERERRVKAKGR